VKRREEIVSEKILLKKSAPLFPALPAVLVAAKGTKPPYDKPNIITIGRATSLTTVPPRLCISVKASAFSYKQILQSGEFSYNYVDKSMVFAADLCGVTSGYDIDKFRETGLTPETTPELTYAPSIGESRLSAGCKVVETLIFEGYGVFIAEIVSVSCREDALDDKERPDPEALEPVYFDGIAALYRSRGEPLGGYGFSRQPGQ
jgi:flavin reductase (DIM6/NTAB) family NADH-FMN oxidoreductase RutF